MNGYDCDDGSEEPPDDLCCPLTLELFVDPAAAADGMVYERSAICEWIASKAADLDAAIGALRAIDSAGSGGGAHYRGGRGRGHSVAPRGRRARKRRGSRRVPRVGDGHQSSKLAWQRGGARRQTRRPPRRQRRQRRRVSTPSCAAAISGRFPARHPPLHPVTPHPHLIACAVAVCARRGFEF